MLGGDTLFSRHVSYSVQPVSRYVRAAHVPANLFLHLLVGTLVHSWLIEPSGFRSFFFFI
jgi:hypothetical protein